MRIERLSCSNGHSLDYEVDEECQGGIMPCQEPGCTGVTGWKRKGLDKEK